MVKFVVVTAKAKRKVEIFDGSLVTQDNSRELLREEDKVNKWLLQGYEILHSVTLEDIKGVYILFVLYKRPQFQKGE